MRATEGQRLILNDGTVIEGGGAGYADGFLWLYFTGMTFVQASQLFCDAGKTVHIVYQYGEMENAYDGFTECMTVQIDSDGHVSVCLKKAVQ